jgi:hypothetical protein
MDFWPKSMKTKHRAEAFFVSLITSSATGWRLATLSDTLKPDTCFVTHRTAIGDHQGGA